MAAFPGAKSLPIWTSDGVPAKDNNDPYVTFLITRYADIDVYSRLKRTDGVTRPITGAFGVVATGSTFCNYTELAPGAEVAWVRKSSDSRGVCD